MSETILAILYTVHLLAAVLWIGGLAMLAVVVIPGVGRVIRDAPNRGASAENMLDAIEAELDRRFTPLSNLSLVVLIVTGMLQMSADENYVGLLQFNNTWAWAMLLKHLAVLGMAVIAAYVALSLEPARRRLDLLAAADRLDDAVRESLRNRRARLVILNLGCGLLTLLFTAIATAQ